MLQIPAPSHDANFSASGLADCGKIRIIVAMEHELRSHMLILADAFSAATSMTLATIGKRALNDNTFLQRIANGDGFNVKTFDRFVAWLSDNWPAETPWPADVARPQSDAA